MYASCDTDSEVFMYGINRFIFLVLHHVEKFMLQPPQRGTFYVTRLSSFPPYECGYLLSLLTFPASSCYSSVAIDTRVSAFEISDFAFNIIVYSGCQALPHSPWRSCNCMPVCWLFCQLLSQGVPVHYQRLCELELTVMVSVISFMLVWLDYVASNVVVQQSLVVNWMRCCSEEWWFPYLFDFKTMVVLAAHETRVGHLDTWRFPRACFANAYHDMLCFHRTSRYVLGGKGLLRLANA